MSSFLTQSLPVLLASHGRHFICFPFVVSSEDNLWHRILAALHDWLLQLYSVVLVSTYHPLHLSNSEDSTTNLICYCFVCILFVCLFVLSVSFPCFLLCLNVQPEINTATKLYFGSHQTCIFFSICESECFTEGEAKNAERKTDKALFSCCYCSCPSSVLFIYLPRL